MISTPDRHLDWAVIVCLAGGGQEINLRKTERRAYLKNAYRVLLTRARQGMVVMVPEGDSEDPTRNSNFYDSTFDYLRGIGFNTI